MNKVLLTILTILLSLFVFTNSNSKKDCQKKVITEALKDTSSNYLDGTYQGQSQAKYTSEPFWGHIQITVENDSFTAIDFMIRDSSLHETVDSMYGVTHYSGNPLYMKQCVNDGHGIEIYPQNLLKSQNIDNVDVYTGASATWSYNIFLASAKDALKDAEKPMD